MAPPRPRVFISRALPGGAEAVERLRRSAEVSVWPEQDPPHYETLSGEAAKSNALLTMITDRIDAALLDGAPNLRVVANLAVGFDNIDIAACTERGVLVCNTPGVLTDAVADHTFAMILALSRRIIDGDRVVREGRWPVWSPTFHLSNDVWGKTIGIIGLGNIGLAVARRARGFGMPVLYHSRSVKPEAEAELGVQRRELADLMRESDYVTIHCPLTPETRGLISAEQIARMKPSGVIVNTTRGVIIDQAAMVEALREKRIGGAALDVFSVEPIPPDDPLLALDNVLVSPHVGSATVETRRHMSDLAVRNIEAFFRGERPPACVNPEVLSR